MKLHRLLVLLLVLLLFGLSSCETIQSEAQSADIDAGGTDSDVIEVEPGNGAYKPVLQNNELVWPVVGWPVEELDTARDVDYLTEVEKDVVLHLNMARANPARYAQEFIRPRLAYFRGTLYREPDEPDNFAGYRTREGVAAVEEAVAVMNEKEALLPLTPAQGLSAAAQDHAADQARSGATGHQGSDGSSPAQRVARYPGGARGVGENIAYGYRNGREIVVQLLVDDGVPSRGHRVNILRPEFRYVGIGVDDHPVYRASCVMNFAFEYDGR